MLLDLRDVSLIADFFVICSASSERQLKAIAETISVETKKKYHIHPYHVNASPGSGWVLMDYSTVVVHVFSHEKRSYYNLEEFWRDATVVLSIQ